MWHRLVAGWNRATSLCSLTARNYLLEQGPLVLLLLLTMAVHLPALHLPGIGHYASRQTATANIARNFVLGRALWSEPRMDEIRGGKRGLLLVDFPLSAYVAGLNWHTLGGSLDWHGRFLNSLAHVVAVAWLVLWMRRCTDELTALASGYALAFSPVAISFGHSFMLEPVTLLLTIVALERCDAWLASGRWQELLSGLSCLALAILTKIYLVVLFMPLLGWLLLAPRARWLPSLLGGVCALVPAAAWYWHCWSLAGSETHAAEVYFSLRESSAAHTWPSPLLHSGEFYRTLFDRLAGLVLTPLGLVALLLGLLRPESRRWWLWLAAMLILVVVLPRKFHDQVYYYLIVLPPLCCIAGIGFARGIWPQLPTAGRWLVVPCLLVVSLRYALVPGYLIPAADWPVIAAGAAVQTHVPSEEPVLTRHGTSNDLLYYCDRPGWVWSESPTAANTPTARYVVLVPAAISDAEPKLKSLLAGATVVAQGNGFALYRLAPQVAKREPRPQ